MIFRETTQEDLDYMADHSMSRGVQKSCPEQTSFIYTLEDNGLVLGTGGFQIINQHTAWCWVDISDIGHDNIILSFKTIRDAIDRFVKEHNLRRLQAYVECDFEEAVRMVRHLGFKKESTMENFVGDKHAYMFVRVF